jgi:hypothetical protein
MQAVIYFQILNDTHYTYEKPIVNALKQQFPELVNFDFDTQSDKTMVGYAVDLLEKSEKAIVIIEATDGSANGIIMFMEKIAIYKNKCMVLLVGQHPLVQKMLTPLDANQVIQADQEDTFMQKLTQFLSAKPL